MLEIVHQVDLGGEPIIVERCYFVVTRGRWDYRWDCGNQIITNVYFPGEDGDRGEWVEAQRKRVREQFAVNKEGPMNTNQTDRELLELAAKAAGYIVEETRVSGTVRLYLTGELEPWDPLADDGDAFRLMIDLDIDLYGDEKYRGADAGNMCCAVESVDGDIYSATRRAIVRAAAEVGKAKV